MASSKALQMILYLALAVLGLSLFPRSEGCWAADSNNSEYHFQFHKVSHYSFFPGNPKWPPSKYNLTYAFLGSFPADKIAPMVQALNEWASKTPFRFTQVSGTVPSDIRISFQRLFHGDGNPFDGKGGVLAHAFAPQDGRVHFDRDDSFSVGAVPNSFDFQSVAVHEIGHLLGLGHSNVPQAIMYPSISSGTVKTVLQADDISGIKALYGF